ncbi:MAG TPA: branched-chain amino acid ABC transporter permease [Acidimicrobiales bacterium]|nr:branched-chain amino acid ABC transporter permease [Acidimicrobiales bacterium]
MSTFVGISVNGLVTGVLFALVAMSLILLYKATGVVNFAQPQAGMISAFAAYWLSKDMPSWLGVLCGLLCGGGLGLVTYLIIVRAKPGKALELSLRTMALFLLTETIAEHFWAAGAPYNYPGPIPQGSINLINYRVSYDQLVAAAASAIVAIGVSLLLSRTRIGLISRAVAADRDAATNLGAPVVTVDVVAWIVAGIVSGVVAILYGTMQSISPTMMDPFVVAGFAAAIIAGFQSMGIAVVAALLLGVVQSGTGVYINAPIWSEVIAFGFLYIGLMVFKGRTALGAAT